MAITTTRTGKKMNPLFLLEHFVVSESLPVETLAFTTFILILLKLDIRPKARFTNAFSAADAGVVGIDSTKDHMAEDNQLVAPLTSLPL